MSNKLLFILLILAIPLAGAAQTNKYSEIAKSVVQIGYSSADIKTTIPLGTGFFVGDGKHVVTAGHVIIEYIKMINDNRGGFLTIKKSSETGTAKFSVSAVVENVDNVHDLAILKFDPNSVRSQWADFEIKSLPLAKEESEMGDEVFIIGHFSMDEHPIASRGIVSGFVKIQVVLPVTELLLDALVNKGQSGSPVISLRTGEVVGVALSIIPISDGSGSTRINSGISRASTLQSLKALINSPDVK
ncbi:MAG: serine protease [Acidobacteriia bacterium]|nr:serine protease [Terriglobia bacterium]